MLFLNELPQLCWNHSKAPQESSQRTPPIYNTLNNSLSNSEHCSSWTKSNHSGIATTASKMISDLPRISQYLARSSVEVIQSERSLGKLSTSHRPRPILKGTSPIQGPSMAICSLALQALRHLNIWDARPLSI